MPAAAHSSNVASSLSRPAELMSNSAPTSLLARDAVVQLQDPMMAVSSMRIILACDVAGPPDERPTALYSGP
eukprot:694782-Alexandrium_andersonii.AAC.1